MDVAKPAWLKFGAAILILAIAPQPAKTQECGSTHPYVGFTGPFSSFEHNVSNPAGAKLLKFISPARDAFASVKTLVENESFSFCFDRK